MRNNMLRSWGLGVLSLLFLVGFAPAAQAQQTGRITGVVSNSTTGQPVFGAQVYLVGLRVGGLTNATGQFLILSAPVGTHEIAVDMIGFERNTQSVTVTAGGTASVDFQLLETAISLEAIVVTGTAAEVRAREVGNALDAVLSRDIENLPITNPEGILGGRVPGLTVVQPGGQPGSGGTIRLRGQTTASQTAEPLIYIDGVRVYNQPISVGGAARMAVSPLQDIAAEDIERIEVIKGASATTLYGTEAASGVIQIFTKRGVPGEPIWSAEVTTGFARQGHIGPDTDPTELYTNCNVEMFGISQSSSTLGDRVFFEDPTCPTSGSWFKDGLQQKYALSVRGGSENVSYYVGTNYSDEQGTVESSRSRDGGFRANLDFRPADAIGFQLNTSYTRRSSRFVEDGNNANGMLLNIGRGTNGNFKGGKGEDCANVSVLCVTNGYLFDSENTGTNNRYTVGLVTTYEPTESISNRLSVGWDYLNFESEEWEPFGYLRNSGGFFSSESQVREKLSLDYTGSFRTTFAESLVSTFSWGGQIFRDRARRKQASTQDFAGPGTPTLTSGGGATGLNDNTLGVTNAGFFLQEVVGYQDRLFVTAGMRVDGNSAFGDDFGLQVYPKVSLSYVVSDHSFWPTAWFDTFKLRAALGESGKAPGAFDKLRTWQPATGDEGTAGFTPDNVGNQEVGPERTREIEVGFDASFLRGRAGLEATYYNTSTTDALVPVTLPVSQGFLASVSRNVGELSGEGLELQASALPYRSDNFEWRVRGNIGFNKTEAIDLEGQEIFGDNKGGIREGHAVPSYFGTKITNPDELAEPELEDNVYLGNTNPTRIIGLNTTFDVAQRFTMDVLFEHQGDFSLPNYTGYQNSRRGVWQPCFAVQEALVAQDSGDPSLIANFTALERARCRMNGIGGQNSDFWVDEADFWKLRSVALTYDLPESWISQFASRGSVTLSGTNLFLWTSYTGNDPELEDFRDRAEGGIFDGNGDYGRREYYNIPAPRTFLLSFRFTF